jgi:C-terminal processing protease CtpA/Prc
MLTKPVLILISTATLLLSACGGNDDEGGVISTDPNVCASQETTNQALWEYLKDDYFWNSQLDLSTDPTQFSSINELLADVRSKVELDRFSFAMTEQEYQDTYINAKFFGYGLRSQLNESQNGLKILYVLDSSNAAKMGLTRGSLITSLNGKTIEDAVGDETYQSNDIWGPNEDGYVLSVTWTNVNGVEESGEMSRSSSQNNTVLATDIFTTNMGKTGYLVFNSFVQRSADDLNTAFDFFKKEDVSELVLDLRYNGGGYISIARQLASQIGGTNVLGKTMLSYIYNNNNSSSNYDVPFNLLDGKDQLNLSRVVILTTQNTASASEMLANALAPYIDVKIVGSRTSGKPVGMSINQLCDHRIFAINFQTVNASGFGDYFDGLPVDCAAEDTVTHNWGDQRDPLLKEALYLINNNSCSDADVGLEKKSKGRVININLLNKNTI